KLPRHRIRRETFTTGATMRTMRSHCRLLAPEFSGLRAGKSLGNKSIDADEGGLGTSDDAILLLFAELLRIERRGEGSPMQAPALGRAGKMAGAEGFGQAESACLLQQESGA